MKNSPHTTEPYVEARVLSTKVRPELHRELRELSAKKDMAVSTLLRAALLAYLAAHKTQA